jgi:hypothetical protein
VVACIPITAGAGRGVPDPKARSKQCESCPYVPNECIVSSCWGGGDLRLVMLLRHIGTCAGTGMQVRDGVAYNYGNGRTRAQSVLWIRSSCIRVPQCMHLMMLGRCWCFEPCVCLLMLGCGGGLQCSHTLNNLDRVGGLSVTVSYTCIPCCWIY